MNKYDDTISFWNNVFIKQVPKDNIKSIKIHRDLEDAINWISNESKTILDYGCGSGTMLLKCAFNKNVCRCLGIDVSQSAIKLGIETAMLNNLKDKIEFYCGAIEELKKIEKNSFDAAILSNIIDNVMPNDAINIMKNISRILKPNGKLLIKLNPYLEQKQLDEYGLQLINNDLYIEKEGIYLRNLSTSQWKGLIKQFFVIKKYKEIYFKEFNQYNRVFLLTNNKNRKTALF